MYLAWKVFLLDEGIITDGNSTKVMKLPKPVTSDKEASLYKTLIANTEVCCHIMYSLSILHAIHTLIVSQFMRHKVQLDDRFRAHKEGVLEPCICIS